MNPVRIRKPLIAAAAVLAPYDGQALLLVDEPDKRLEVTVSRLP